MTMKETINISYNLEDTLKIEYNVDKRNLDTENVKQIGSSKSEQYIIKLTWHGLEQKIHLSQNLYFGPRIYKIDGSFLIIVWDTLIYYKNEIKFYEMINDIIFCVFTKDYFYLITVLEVVKFSKKTLDIIDKVDFNSTFLDYKIINNELEIELEDGHKIKMKG